MKSARARLAGRLLILVLLVLGSVSLAASPASAHRSGCHRWHSCPSDTGSYVCGDLGDFSQCPTSSTPATLPSSDVDAPAAPVLGSPGAIRGLVSLPVRAERGSKIQVRDDLAVLLTVGATGALQTLHFQARNGVHALHVTATDAANNVSDMADATVTVDSIPPAKPQVLVTPPTGLLAFTALAITGEPAANYAVHVARRVGGAAIASLTRQGVLDGGGQAAEKLLVANGAYTVGVLLSDIGHNTSPAVTSQLTVALAAPTMSLRRLSATNSGQMQIAVSGPATGSGTIAFTADGPAPVTAPFTLDDTGTGVATAQLSDTRWTAGASVTDFQHRQARASLSGLVVDTVAPRLGVTLDRRAAKNRHVLAMFNVEAGSTVTVNGLPGGNRTFSNAGPVRLDRRTDDGTYHMTFRAVDLAGNQTVRNLNVTVSHPLTLSEALIGLGALSAIGVGVFLGIRILWRRRFDIQARRVAGRMAREHNRALVAHQAALAAHGKAVANHARAHAAWVSDGEQLRAIAAETHSYDGGALALPYDIKSTPGEAVYSHVERGGLVELRRPNGYDIPTVIESGDIWVTDQRIVFEGSKRREWRFDKLLDVSDVGADATMLRVSNRQKASGISYPGTSQATVRRHLALAIATSDGTRERLITAAEVRVASHLRSEPQPPGPPPSAPLPTALPTAGELREKATVS